MIRSNREGFALAATIMAMLVVGAIVTGGFYAASQEGDTTRSATMSDEALYIAEAGLNAALGSTVATTLRDIGANDDTVFAPVDVTQGGTTLGNYQVSISRVADALYYFTSRGVVTRGGRHAGAAHTLATVARLRTANFDTQTAIQVFGSLSVGGTSDINGNDQNPSDWSGECGTTRTGTSAVVTNYGTNISSSGNSHIDGPITRRSLNSNDFLVFGDMTWSEVVALANIVYAPGFVAHPSPSVVNGLCNTSDIENWGAPLNNSHACFDYFPIIYARGNLKINAAGSGQGIILVEGDLELSGGYTFFGVVVTKGELKVTGSGGHVNGTTIAFGGGDLSSLNTTRGSSLLQYSSCAIERATMNNNALARAIPIPHRSWLDVSAIQNW